MSYNGNGSTVNFAFSNKFFENSDLVVKLIALDTTETVQVLDSDYTVTGAGSSSGGTVTMAVAPAVGEILTIERVLALTQEVDYTSGGAFPAETHERALDRLTMIAQQVSNPSLNTSNITNGAVTTEKIAAAAVTTEKIANESVSIITRSNQYDFNNTNPSFTFNYDMPKDGTVMILAVVVPQGVVNSATAAILTEFYSDGSATPFDFFNQILAAALSIKTLSYVATKTAGTGYSITVECTLTDIDVNSSGDRGARVDLILIRRFK